MPFYFQVILGKFQKIQRKNIVVNTILLVIISFLWILILVSCESAIPSPVPTAFVMVMICMILFTLQSQWKITEIGICPGVIPLVILGIVTAALSQLIWFDEFLKRVYPSMTVTFGRFVDVSNNSGA